MILLIFRFIAFSAILYFSYRFLFSRMSFFRLNRGIILAIPVFSLLIPLIAPFFSAPPMVQPALSVLLHEVNPGSAETTLIETVKGFSLWWIIYALGALSVLVSTLIGLIKARKILKRAKPAFENVHVSTEAIGPFAFFRKIVIPSTLLTNEGLPAIIAHEQAHVEQYHAYDILLYNFLCTLFWFNPIIHLLNRELRQVHECLADEAALAATSRESYAHLLLNSVFGSEISFDTTNRFFNSSLIKTRITMMYKTKTKQKMKGLYLAFLPLIILMIIISCQKQELNSNSSNANVKAGETELVDFAELDQPPLFPSCDVNDSKEDQLKCFQENIAKYVTENFKYPESAKKANLKGKMYVSFIITEEGNIGKVRIDTKFPENTDGTVKGDAAVAGILAVKKLRGLRPATINGKPVAVKFVVPINMKLE